MFRFPRFAQFWAAMLHRWRLSLFEKVILANSMILIGEALAGLWVTSHNLEAHHYLIDISFIVLATVLGLLTNVLILRASFRPLFSLLHTIREVSSGKVNARATMTVSDSEISELAQAFNTMLDRLETAHKEQAMLILQAQEEERRRIALELHDESSQNLTALLIHTEILSQSLPAAGMTKEAHEQLHSSLNQLEQLTQRTLEDIRTLAQQLRPGVLDDLGLLAAFRWLAEDSRQRLHLDVTLRLNDIEGDEHNEDDNHTSPLPASMRRHCFASPRNVSPTWHVTPTPGTCGSLSQDTQAIFLQVRDDGCGYAPSQDHEGLGVFGMRERATLLGGRIEI